MSDIREGTCPKCEAAEVYKSPQFDMRESNHGGIIPIKGGIFPRYARVQNYVCAKCGYLESFVLEEKDLQDISREWEQVNPLLQRKKKNDEG